MVEKMAFRSEMGSHTLLAWRSPVSGAVSVSVAGQAVVLAPAEALRLAEHLAALARRAPRAEPRA